MSLTSRWALAALILFLAGPILARSLTDPDRPALLSPKSSASRLDLDRREAQRLYGVGILHERNNRLVEALKAYEDAKRLDPDAAAIHRSLFSMYLTLDRVDDALKTGRVVMRLDPEDYHTAYLVARQLRGLDRGKEAIDALEHSSRAKKIHERPDLEAQVWIEMGMLHEKGERLGDAEKAFEHAASLLDKPEVIMASGRFKREEVDQQCAEVLERVGRVCLRAKRISRAIEAFEKAKKKDALRAPRLSFNLAQVYDEQNKPSDALAQLENYLRSQPSSVDGYELRIALQRKLNRDADVLTALEASSGRDPNNLSLRLLLGREYRKGKRRGEARELYAVLLKEHVTPEVYRGLFELYKDEGAVGAERLLTMLDKTLDAAGGDEKRPPDASEGRRARAMMAVLREEASMVGLILDLAIRPTRLARLSFTTRGVLATLASKTKQLAEAESLYRSCLDQLGGPAQQEAEIYSGLVRVLRLQNKHEAMLELCKKGLTKAQNTNRVLFHTEMLRAHQYLGDHKAALKAADLAVQDAGSQQLLMCKRLRVDVLIHAGEHARALMECQSMLKEYNTGGDLRDVRATLSQVYQAMGKMDESEQQLRMILESDPNDATANNDLGYVMADRNKELPEAERLVRKAIELDRQQSTGAGATRVKEVVDNAAYVDSLGWVLFREGKLAEAIAELEKASKLDGGYDDPVVWDHLGDVYHRTKQGDRAAVAWKKSLALYEAGARRKGDPRYKEIQDKIRLVTPTRVTP